jgi:AmmeMemoRadiSam system protein A
MTADNDRRALLAVARAAILANVIGQASASTSSRSAGGPEGPQLRRRMAGAFVSLHMHGRLRGCIGRIEADGPLVDTIADCARLACSADPRFPAVTVAELDILLVEISILGALEPVVSLDEVEIGRHGLLVEDGRCRGLLLPQVAMEWGWNAKTFVEHTCQKAGLPRDGWARGAALWRFEAEIFSEARYEPRRSRRIAPSGLS